MVLGGSVGADHVKAERLDPASARLHGRSDGPHPVLPIRVFQDRVDVDGPTGPEGSERIREELHGGMGEVQDDPVHGGDLPQDGPRVPFPNLHAVRAIRRDILSEEFDRRRVRVRGDDPSGRAAASDQDRVRSYARERVRDGLARGDLRGHARPFAAEPRAEVGSRHIHAVPEAVLRVDGRRPRLPRHDLEVPHAQPPCDAPVLGDRTEVPVPCQDRAAEFRPVGHQRLWNLQDGDVPDHVERGRELGPQGVRHAGHVLVAPDGREGLLEVVLLRR